MTKLIKHWENDKVIAQTTTKLLGDFSKREMNTQLKKLGFDKFVWAEQVHSNKISRISTHSKTSYISGVDGFISGESGTALVIRTADCVPIFFTDSKNQYIAIVHAGWKGTFKKIAMSVILEFKKYYGVDPGEILVHIGPHIRQNCYEVKKHLALLFQKEFGDCVAIVNNKYYLSLTKANINTLTECKVLPENITVSEDCTFCRKDLLFSYRRERFKTKDEYKEMVSYISLK